MSLYSDYLDSLQQLLGRVEYSGYRQPEQQAFLSEAAAAGDGYGRRTGKVSRLGTGLNKYIASQGIDAAAAIIEDCGCRGKKVIWIGNGGSAAIASHGAIDYWKNGGIKSIAFNEGSLLTCIGNDYGYAAVFQKPLEMFAEENDVLMAISSSGQSENILNGVRTAKKVGCKVITFSGFSADNPLRFMGDINFYVPSYHYGHVELVHGILCHCLLDLLISKTRGKKTW